MAKDIDKWMREQQNNERMERYEKKMEPKKTGWGASFKGVGSTFDSITKGARGVQKGLAPFQPSYSADFGMGGNIFGQGPSRRRKHHVKHHTYKANRPKSRKVVTYYY